MKHLVLVIAISLFTQAALAQDGYGSTSVYDAVIHLPTDKHIFVVPANAEWSDQKWKDSVYRYDEFQIGRMEMANGFKPSHHPLLNYNSITEGMSIKTSTGEIISMTKSLTIRFVWVGDHQFINDKTYGYLEIIARGKAILAQKVVMRGAYELSNGSIYPLSAVDEMNGGNTYVKTPLKRNTRYLWKEEQLFLMGSNLRALRATPGALKYLVPRQKKEIKRFSHSNHIDYRKKDEVMKIVTYANRLDSMSNIHSN